MKRMRTILILALALGLTPVLAVAQTPSVGVYFDTDGLQAHAVLNGGNDETHTAWVLAFSDTPIAGAAFMLDILPDITILDEIYFGGTAIGSAKTGLELTLDVPVDPAGQPVVLGELTLFTGEFLVYYGRLNTIPHPSFSFVSLSDGQGASTPAAGTCAYLTVPVDDADTTWGGVKELFR